MKIAIVVAMLLWAGTASALDPWTASDWKREAVFAAAVVGDLSLSSVALEQGTREWNPLLGERPSHAKLWTVGLSGVLFHAGVARLLPRDWRDAWQAAGISLEIVIVGRNAAFVIGAEI